MYSRWKEQMFGKTLENKNTCLYNKTMNIEIKNSNYTTQEKLQILADAAKYDVACTSSVPAAVERKENSAIQRHAASVTVLQRTEDVFLY